MPRADVPCILERTSGPWTPASPSSRRWKVPPRRPRPARRHIFISIRFLHPQLPSTADGNNNTDCHRKTRRYNIGIITYHSELLKRPSSLDILERSLEILQLEVDLLLGALGILDGLDLESLDSLELARDVVLGGLEGGEALLDFVDDGLVLEHGAVVREVDGGGQLG